MYTEAPSTVAGDAPPGTPAKGMWSFQYKHGDRPLEGYTIQRAAGRGGFGEVYYAISDAGREVALKVITGFEQIELRGISQCMNLKSPHLVTIFDVKQNAEGRSFVIMEFVSGLNLRELLDQSPSGLGTQKAAFFLREIAKGLSYLHDCGIVHRDLKPANIFYENGYVKIGDYGLSKAIAPTHHSGQTVTVGTVHYMAPEVGVGKYDRSIDIYALGALLYEMLTGVVPFVGASAGEILIKHLSQDADCSGIPEPFCTAIKKAMAKDPDQRFQTVQELVEAVFGEEHVRNSVSQFAPQELSMIAERVAQRIRETPPKSVTPPPIIGGVNTSSSVTAPNGLGTPGNAWAAGYVSGHALHTGKRITDTILGPFADSTPRVDPIPLGQRIGIAAVATFVIATCAVIFSGSRSEPETWFFTTFGIIGGSVGTALVGRKWLPWRRPENRWMDRFALAGAGACSALTLAFIVWADSNEHARWAGGMFIAVLAGLAVANPRRWLQSDRKQRANFGWPAAAGGVAFALAAAFDNECNPAVAIAIAGGIALIVQMLTPWDERAAAARADNGDDDESPAAASRAAANAETRYTGPAAAPAPPAAAAPSPQPSGGLPVLPFIPPMPASMPWQRYMTSSWDELHPPKPRPARVPVPRGMLIVWFLLATLAFCLGTGFFVATILDTRTDPDAVAASAACFTIATWAFIRLCHRTISSWWIYLIIPLIRLGFAIAVVVTFCQLEFDLNLRPSGRSDFTTAMTICFTLWLLTWIVPLLWRLAIPPTVSSVAQPISASGSSVGTSTTTPELVAGDSATQIPQPTVQPISQHASIAPMSTKPARRAPRDLGGTLANLAGIGFLITAVLALLFIAVDVPKMVAIGVPDPSLAEELRRDVFGSSVQDWPSLVRNTITPFAIVLLMLGGGFLLVARRNGGALHMLRAVFGVLGLAFACTPLQGELSMLRPWERLTSVPIQNRGGWSAVEVFVDSLRGGAVMSAFILLAAIVVLIWPSKRATDRREEVAI